MNVLNVLKEHNQEARGIIDLVGLFVNTDNNPSFTSTWETDYKSLFESILSTIRTSWQT